MPADLSMFSVVLFATLMGMVVTGPDDLPEYRLPGYVIPDNYVLEVTVDVCGQKYHGSVNIKIKCVKPTSTIKLHSKGLTIGTEVYISKGEEGVDKVKCTFTIDADHDFLIITVPKELEKEVSYTLNIPYEGDLMPKVEGLYLQEPTKPSEDQLSWYVATNVRARARTFFPCFDEPALRATFTLKVQHHKSLKAISTMAAVNEEEYFRVLQSERGLMSSIMKPFNSESTLESMCNTNGPNKDKSDSSNMVWEEFHKTPRMSPHMLGLVVATLTKEDLHGVARLWSFKHKPIQPTTPMFNLIPKIHKYLVNNFDLQFPLPKLDVIVLGHTKFLTFYGSIIVPEEMVLPDKLHVTAAQMIAHGLASQWIDGAVCIKWWSDLWFTWALAEYMATRALDYELTFSTLTSSYDNIVTFYSLHEVYKLSEEEDRPVYTIINRPEELIYDHWETIAFKKKGPLLMRMLHLYIGSSPFRKGLTSFLKDLRMTGSCVDHTDLWRAFQLTSISGDETPTGMTVELFMEGWITQTDIPLVTLTRKDEGIVYASQRPYRNYKDSKDQANDPSEKCWAVPLRLLSSKAFGFPSLFQSQSIRPRKFTKWLTCQEPEKKLTDSQGQNSWYIANVQLSGPYKVRHDDESLQILGEFLYTPTQLNVGEMNRAQLIDEVLDGSRHGEIDYTTAFGVLRYLKYDHSYLPWKAARQGLKFLKQNLSRQKSFLMYKAFIRRMVTAIYEKYRGFQFNNDIVEKMLKDIMKWACEFDCKTCRQDAYKFFDLFKTWKQSRKGTQNPVPSHFRRIVYCNGVNRGFDKDFNTMMEFLERSEDDEKEKKQMVFGLSCIPHEVILKSYLEKTIDIDTVFPKHLDSYAFRKVAANDNGFKVALNFMTDNKQYISGSTFHNLPLEEFVVPLARRATSAEDFKKIKSLIGPEFVPKSAKDLNEAYKAAEENMVWLQKYSESMVGVIENADY